MTNHKNLIYKHFNLSDEDLKLSLKIEEQLNPIFEKLDKIKEINQYKVLKAMQESRLSDIHFNSQTGYGYNDIGREKVEEIYSRIFGTEDALVRPNIVNGTHALTICLQGLLMPGDEMIAITGKPYDTLDKVIGISKHDLSLSNYGVKYTQVDLLENGDFNLGEIEKKIQDSLSLKMIYIQRSKGYSRRRSITINDIKEICCFIRTLNKDAIIMIDNCYGEFIDELEPTDVGADIMAGSLIKNPGGGLAITGGYVVGKQALIDIVSQRLTSPGIGKECGLTFGTSRLTLQGLFMAPSVVNSALKGAIFCSKLFDDSGYDVFPKYSDERSDIIQAVGLNSESQIISFCEAIQQAAPVDSFVSPAPWAMPGYENEVIMAAGAFVQGSSIELSADAPIKEPYTVYFQGGITYEHSKLGALMAYSKIKNKEC